VKILDKNLEIRIKYAEEYQRKTGMEMVVIKREGIYETWDLATTEKYGHNTEIVWPEDKGPMKETPIMPIVEYTDKVSKGDDCHE